MSMTWPTAVFLSVTIICVTYLLIQLIKWFFLE